MLGVMEQSLPSKRFPLLLKIHINDQAWVHTHIAGGSCDIGSQWFETIFNQLWEISFEGAKKQVETLII